jgi:hypothetical protein
MSALLAFFDRRFERIFTLLEKGTLAKRRDYAAPPSQVQ